MAVTNWGLAFEDRTLKKPARMTVDDLNVSAENFSTKKGTQANVGIANVMNTELTALVGASYAPDTQVSSYSTTTTGLNSKPPRGPS